MIKDCRGKSKKKLRLRPQTEIFAVLWARAMTYDLAVAYRIYPGIAKRPALYPNDKFRLSQVCLNSFRAALGDLRVKIFVLLDGCPPEYAELFRGRFSEPDLELITLPRIGNRPTFGRQIDLLMEQQHAELVYFAEDDYFYRANGLVEMVEFIRGNSDADFVTPHDHPDWYHLPLHSVRQEIRPFGRRHWRTAASTCLTFLTRQFVLRKTAPVFRTYERTNLDVSLWMTLTKQTALNPIAFLRCCRSKLNYGGYIAMGWRYNPFQLLFGRKWRLWCPVPAVGTHMEDDLLAPSIDWPEVFAREAKPGK